MEQVDLAARPSWLADEQASTPEPVKAEPAPKAVPWRTPEGPRPTAKATPRALPAAPAAPAAYRRPLWERLLPLIFLVIFVLVVGGYLAGWHLG